MSAYGLYTLDDAGEPVPCTNALEWGRWMQTADRHVGDTEIGNMRVSTIFLGIDHQFGIGGPVLWESMIFGDPMHGEQRRYSSRIEAELGHLELVEAAKASLERLS